MYGEMVMFPLDNAKYLAHDGRLLCIVSVLLRQNFVEDRGILKNVVTLHHIMKYVQFTFQRTQSPFVYTMEDGRHTQIFRCEK